MKEHRFINRELSWLDFNARVARSCRPYRAAYWTLSIYGIFSNNLDEFFKVRYATVSALLNQPNQEEALGGVEATDLLASITERVIDLQQESAKVLEEIEGQLVQEDIHFLRENEVTEAHAEFLTSYFYNK